MVMLTAAINWYWNRYIRILSTPALRTSTTDPTTAAS
jgi:hypothetical protein